MLLSVPERIVILQGLPAEGAYLFMLDVKSLAQALDFSEFETKEIGLHIDRETRSWVFDPAKAKEKDIPLTSEQKATLAQILKDLSDKKRLSASLLRVYETFLDQPNMLGIEERVTLLERKLRAVEDALGGEPTASPEVDDGPIPVDDEEV